MSARKAAGPPRAVVLRALGLGDFLTGVPALRALRAVLPEHELVLAAPGALGPLVRLAGGVDLLLPTAELAPVRVDEPPDIAVDLHGNGPASKRLLQVLRPRRLMAFAGPGGDGGYVDGPRWRAEEHEVARWCRLVEECFGVRADPGDLRLATPTTRPPVPQAVVVHPGAASEARRWPADRFAAVARWAAGAGGRVVVTGSASERGLAEEVARAAGLPADAVLAGRTDLDELAALVADAALVVCGDTGMAHLATAFGRPSVVLFGPIPPARWGPPADGPHDAIWHGHRVGDPHADRVDPTLLRISVDEVIDRAAARSGLSR